MTEKIHKTQLGDIHYWTNILNNMQISLKIAFMTTAQWKVFLKIMHNF